MRRRLMLLLCRPLRGSHGGSGAAGPDQQGRRQAAAEAESANPHSASSHPLHIVACCLRWPMPAWSQVELGGGPPGARADALGRVALQTQPPELVQLGADPFTYARPPPGTTLIRMT